MKYSVLFYDDEDPIDYRSIRRFVSAFSPNYTATVQTIIPNSEELTFNKFKCNMARLMPSFKMTRVGAFHGLKIRKDGCIDDPNHVTDKCWKKTHQTLQKVKLKVQQSRFDRKRAIVGLPPEMENHVIEQVSEAFETLRNTKVKIKEKTHPIGRVGASKVLFSVLPEVALPVDKSEFVNVFKTNNYGDIIRTMIKEIKLWEQKTKKRLEETDPLPVTTLPSIYNVMAMSARPQKPLKILKSRK